MCCSFGNRSLLVATAVHTAVRTNVPSSLGIPCQIAVLDRSLPILIDVHATFLPIMYRAVAQHRVASRFDRHSCKGIAHDVAVLEPPLTVLIDVYPIMDRALAHNRA